MFLVLNFNNVSKLKPIFNSFIFLFPSFLISRFWFCCCCCCSSSCCSYDFITSHIFFFNSKFYLKSFLYFFLHASNTFWVPLRVFILFVSIINLCSQLFKVFNEFFISFFYHIHIIELLEFQSLLQLLYVSFFQIQSAHLYRLLIWHKTLINRIRLVY